MTIGKADSKGSAEVRLQPLIGDHLEFLLLLQDLSYIDDATIIRETLPHAAVIDLNGLFAKNFHADMKRES